MFGLNQGVTHPCCNRIRRGWVLRRFSWWLWRSIRRERQPQSVVDRGAYGAPGDRAPMFPDWLDRVVCDLRADQLSKVRDSREVAVEECAEAAARVGEDAREAHAMIVAFGLRKDARQTGMNC